MSVQDRTGTPFVPLAIVGIGCLFPRAENARSYWLNIKRGTDCITDVPPSHWNPDDYFDRDPKSPDRTYAVRGGFLEPVDFSPIEFGIAPNDLEATDTSQLLGLVAAKQALRDAGYGDGKAFDRSRVSTILGVTGTLELVIPLGARLGHPKWKKALDRAGVPEAQSKQVMDEIAESYVGWQENSFPGLLGNVVAGRIANRLDLGGTNCVVDAACASSLSAIHLASLELAAGRSDMVVTGGVDTFNDIFMFMCFSKTPALSPTGDAKPFDIHGDGTILGEGLGIVVLKRLADAERDGDRIYAVIRGLGSSSDGKGNAIYAPVAAGQVKALRRAYHEAGITPNTIELIEGHGTGTRVGDGVEVSALSEVYREAGAAPANCALGSVKSQIGHTKAAAGAAGLIKAALALHFKVLPPTLKVTEPLELLKGEESPFYVNTDQRPWIGSKEHPRRAAVSAFGFGGSNFHCVLEEHGAKQKQVDWPGDVEIVALSSPDKGDLSRRLAGLREQRTWAAVRQAGRETRHAFAVSEAHRLLLVVQKDTDIAHLVDAAAAKLRDDAAFWRLPEGACYGSGAPAGTLAVLFPGQGSQYVGMLRDLACTFPEMKDVLADGNRVFARMAAGEFAGRLSDAIYPPASFNKDGRETRERRLRRTEVAQPAIGAVALGALKVLESFGLSADAYAGHSYGELPALCAAGVLDDEALHTVSRLRGHLMASFRTQDAGSMLAVHAPLAAIQQVINEESLDLVIANRNAPSQAVLSGASAEIDRATSALDRRQLRHTRLPVAAAFHSPLVARAREPFHEALSEVTIGSTRKPVFANTTGAAYPSEPTAIRALLSGQLAEPVEFTRQIEAMAHDGVRTFVEVGPGSTLTKLVSSILGDRTAEFPGWDAFAIDASTGKRSGILDLAQTLARIAAHGHPLDLKSWNDDGIEPEPPKKGLLVPICGANYVAPKPVKRELPKPAVLPTPAPVPIPQVIRVVPPEKPRRMYPTTEPTVSGESLSQALQVTQQSLAAFQSLQEQTANLHRQFLESQEAAQRTLQMLVDQQHVLLTGVATPKSMLAPVRAVTPQRPAAPHRNGDSNGHAPKPTAPPVSRDPEAPRREARNVQPARSAPEAPRVAANGDVAAVLLAVVAEKTGYPTEMLYPEMALDADLGIDSIKRVEIFSALQEKLPGSPIVQPEQLGTLHTLADVIAFLSTDPLSRDSEGFRRVARDEQPQQKRSTPATVHVAANGDVATVLLAVVSEKTGYPTEMLNPEMALDADLGIDSIKRVEIFSALQEKLPGSPIVQPEQLGTLHTLADVIAFLSGPNAEAPAAKKKSVAAPAEADAAIERGILRAVPHAGNWQKCVKLAPGSTVVLVAELSPLAESLSGWLDSQRLNVVRATWSDAAQRHDAAALILLAPATPDTSFPLRSFQWLRSYAKSAGRKLFATISSLGGTFGIDQLQGDAVAGCLAGLAKTAVREWPGVSCKAIDASVDAPIDLIAQALLQDEATEVGVSAFGFTVLELDIAAAPPRERAFSSSDVVLVTGGARGVTAAVAEAIAADARPTLILFGRTPIDAAEPAFLNGCGDEAAVRRALISNRRGSTPKAIDAECRAIMAAREARAAIERMRAHGSRVEYHAVDVTDAATVSRVLKQVGPITHVIHGAGVLADRKIEDVTDEQFVSVFETKVAGITNILNATSTLKGIVLFSSSTGRFGRVGQVAYAAANEALNKIAQRERHARPVTRVVAMNWGPWSGGMVTPALKQLFASEGVGTIPLHQGADLLLRELTADRTNAEITIIARPDGYQPPAAPVPTGAIEHVVSVERYPVLRSHVLSGKAVLPLALHVELLAHAALHGQPGLAFAGFDQLRLLKGVQLTAQESRSLHVLAGQPIKADDGLRVPVSLHSSIGSRDVVHSRADVLLAHRPMTAATVLPLQTLEDYPHRIEHAYNRLLFHGDALRGIEAIDGVSATAIVGRCRTAPAPTQWLAKPLRHAWIADPLVLDAAFQLMILWSQHVHGKGCLPVLVGEYRQFLKAFPAGRVQVRVRITDSQSALVRADIEFVGETGQLLASIKQHESVIDESLNAAFRLNTLDAGGPAR